MVLAKFQHPTTTIDGSERASVKFFKLKTIWFNTGSLCNITCKNCFMESSPKNNALSYLSSTDVINTLNEIESFPSCLIVIFVLFFGSLPIGSFISKLPMVSPAEIAIYFFVTFLSCISWMK